MKKILFFETPIFTGATRVTRTIAKTLQGRYEVAFAIVEPNNDNLKGEIEEIIRKNLPQIIFSSFVSINPEVVEVGKDLGLYVVIRQDYNLCDLTENNKQRVIKTYPRADFIIAQTLKMKLEMLANKELRDCRIKVIDNPLDKEDILQKAAGPNPFENNGNFHFIWVGRNDPIKDLTTLYKAFEIVHERYSNTDLTLITDNPNPYKWMKHADCLVISSISEASPNVLKEALFLGTRVISTNCSPTVKDLIPSQMVVPIQNPTALSKAMMRVIKLSDECK